MSDTTGAATGMVGGAIAFANDWYVTGKVNWRIAVATPIAGAFLYGTSKISEPLGTGLGIAILVVVLVTPVAGSVKSPMQSVIDITGGKSSG